MRLVLRDEILSTLELLFEAGALTAFALALAFRVALIRYRRVSRNSAALIFPSIKHFLPQPFPLYVIRHCSIPRFSTDRHDAGSPPGSGAVLDVASIAPPSSTQEITPAIHA